MYFAEENKDGLAVAHFTGGNVEIIQPLKVTETHVIIDIRELSNFVLVWIKSKLGFPIRGQVLLFLRALSLEKNKLNVHLLPENVPVSEVLLSERIVPLFFLCAFCLTEYYKIKTHIEHICVYTLLRPLYIDIIIIAFRDDVIVYM